jgi:DNA polymerase III alpha subunit
MEQAQDYSFNKSHAACYALIAFRTAYLKANYPAEYMAALISSVMNTKDKVPFYVAACEELGIEVLPPDVNVSALDFAVVDGKIRFGLNAVKNVGESACRAVIAAREEGGPFSTLWDFCERVDPQVVNKRALESLVKAGALDSTGATRKGMLAVLEQALSWGGRHHADRLLGQSSIFDLGPGRRRRSGRGTIRRSRPRSSRSRSASRSRKRCSASTSPSTRCTGSETSFGARRTCRSRRSAVAGTARSSRSAGSSARFAP